MVVFMCSTQSTYCSRWKGWNVTGAHFYNWYDTQSLKPLLPIVVAMFLVFFF